MSLHWIPLENMEQLEEIRMKSQETPCIIFKHSTRCSISIVALQRLENAPNFNSNAFYFFLDLLKFREISNAVAALFEIHHESPQVLLVSKGECVYDETHLGIDAKELQEQINAHL